MRRSVVALLVGVTLVGVAIGAIAWSVPYATTARGLYLFEGESPTEIVDGAARQGAGLLGLDVVTLSDGRVLEVHRQGEPRRQWPRPEFLVGEYGARYADEPPAEGVWRAFAVRAGVAGLVALLSAVAGIWTLVRSRFAMAAIASRLGFVIFGQRDPETKPVWWVAGGGSHGAAGGQVPPMVPYNPDWDPDRRIP